MTIKVLYFGATGYLGGEIVSKLISSPLNCIITCLVRREVPQLHNLDERVRVLKGDINDYELAKRLAKDSDIVINAANGNLLDLVRGVLDGLIESINPYPIFIQTSGAAVIADDTRGMYASDIVYSDLDTHTLNDLPATQPRRQIDPLIASYGDRINAHIILPTTIYGSTHVTFANQHSIQIPQMVIASIRRKQAGVIGGGLNKWGNVHVSDAAELYLLILNQALDGVLRSSIHGSYFFVNSDEHSLLDISNAIARSLLEKGVGTAVPTTYTEDEVKTLFNGSYFNATNVRTASNHANMIGWKPTYTTKDLLKSVE